MINQTGLNEIHAFLGRYHKKGRDHFDDSMLQAWAADAEYQASLGNGYMIEIRGMDSITGNPMCFTVSDEGVDHD